MARAADAGPVSIVLTGPESSGKSTLAGALAVRLQRPLVREVARDWLNARGGRYSRSDLTAIAIEQDHQERLARASAAPVVDTDLTVITVWSEYRYGSVDPHIRRLLDAAPPRVYLLCEPDLAWVPDPLRENPSDRDRLLEHYECLLAQLPWRWARVNGSGAVRIERALAGLDRMGVPVGVD